MIIFTTGRKINHPAAKTLGNISNPASDIAKTNYAPGLAGKLIKPMVKMSKHAVIYIIFIFHVIVIISEFFHQVKKQGEGMLCHALCRVAGYISPFDASFSQISLVQVVGSCCSHTDQLKLICFPNGLLIDFSLVEYNHVRIPCSFPRLFRCGIRISDHFSKLVVARQIYIFPY